MSSASWRPGSPSSSASPNRRCVALVATHGHEIGREATAEALAWAWEHWDRITVLDNPVGYLYRVGQTQAQRFRRQAGRTASLPTWSTTDHTRWVEPGLDGGLASLTEHQRVAVVLCHGYQWTHREVGELLDVAPSTIQNHIERGLAKLRAHLGEAHHERSG